MLVRSVMIEDVTAVSPDDTLQKAYDLIQTKHYDCLPVLTDRRHVSGIVQLTDIYEACLKQGRDAAMASKVSTVMVTNMVTIHPDEPIEKAAKLMDVKDVPLLPVVEDGEFLGVINEDDIFKAFALMLGADSNTVRLTLVVPERKGALAQITEIISDAGLSITSIAQFHSAVFDQYRVVVRFHADSTREVVSRLEHAGHKVIHIDHD